MARPLSPKLRTRLIASIVATLLFEMGALAAKPPMAPDDIVRKADESRAPSGAFSFEVKVSDLDGESVIRETRYKVYGKGNTLSLIETTAPDRLKGRKLLMRGNDLWLYLPTIRRPTRVSLQQKLTGEVANGDIARVNFGEDYSAESKGVETVEGKKCYKLYLSAKQKDVTYRNIDYWVEQSTFFPVKSVFYAISGKPLKTGTYTDYVEALGHKRIAGLTIADELLKSRRSLLKYSNFRRESLSDNFFNKESLAE